MPAAMKRGYCVIKTDTRNNSTNSPNKATRNIGNRREAISTTPSQGKYIKTNLKNNIIHKNMKDFNF